MALLGAATTGIHAPLSLVRPLSPFDSGESAVRTYRKHPTDVDAIRWTGKNYENVGRFLYPEDSNEDGQGLLFPQESVAVWEDQPIVVLTKHGGVTCRVGDWITRYPSNDLVIYSHTDFQRTFFPIPPQTRSHF